MLPLGRYGIGLLFDGGTVDGADIGGTTNDAIVRFTGLNAVQEQFGAFQDDAVAGTVARIRVRGSYTVSFVAAFVPHVDTAAVIMGITKNTDAAGLNSAMAMGTTGRQYIGGEITIPALSLILLPFKIGGGFVVEDSEAEATALEGAAAGALIRCHATVAATHPSANTVNGAQAALWHFRIERMGDIQGITRP